MRVGEKKYMKNKPGKIRVSSRWTKRTMDCNRGRRGGKYDGKQLKRIGGGHAMGGYWKKAIDNRGDGQFSCANMGREERGQSRRQLWSRIFNLVRKER